MRAFSFWPRLKTVLHNFFGNKLLDTNITNIINTVGMYHFLDVLASNKNDSENREKNTWSLILLLICPSRTYILLFIVGTYLQLY